MEYEQAVNRYFEWCDQLGIPPLQPSWVDSAGDNWGWMLRNTFNGAIAYVTDGGDVISPDRRKADVWGEAASLLDKYGSVTVEGLRVEHGDNNSEVVELLGALRLVP